MPESALQRMFNRQIWSRLDLLIPLTQTTYHNSSTYTQSNVCAKFKLKDRVSVRDYSRKKLPIWSYAWSVGRIIFYGQIGWYQSLTETYRANSSSGGGNTKPPVRFPFVPSNEFILSKYIHTKLSHPHKPTNTSISNILTTPYHTASYIYTEINQSTNCHWFFNIDSRIMTTTPAN